MLAQEESQFDAISEGKTAGDKLARRAKEKQSPEREQESDANGNFRDDASGGGTASAPMELRTNFSETAFWFPQLVTDAQGSATIEFSVPDSLTDWSVWLHAITQDLKSGTLSKQTKSVKELMVRPYLPRFLREGDSAEIRVVVNSTAKRELNGTLRFDIIDPETQKSLLDEFGFANAKTAERAFRLAKDGSVTLSFPLKAPAKIKTVAFKVTARAGDHTDGEQRALSVLPGRMHLAQSRFVTLKNKDRKELAFKDLADASDPTRIHEQLVVTLDAQLFYSVLSSLPYLVNYPYECIEQTLNRFVSTGILTSFFDKFPAIREMAKAFSAQRKTRFETWDQADPNRKLTLEESPWLELARGGTEKDENLLNVLDPQIALEERKASLRKLVKAQTASGAFPWFPGGPPSPFITLYVLYGFSKAMEFGVELPKEMTARAWSYLHEHYLDADLRTCMKHDGCWEFITFLNYVLSNYPDTSWGNDVFTEAERRTMLDFSFKHWKNHSPYLKGYLALTLSRMQRASDAKLVWDSVMDSAKYSEDEGTHWQIEDRSWLWYNDTIETHAFALRTGMELSADAKKMEGLVHWLFLNKKLNHWKSTRATAEVIYSLAYYLRKTNQLGVKEDAKVTLGGQSHSFEFQPDRYTGKKNQIVVAGNKIDAKFTPVIVEKTTPGMLFASATWHFSTEKMPKEASGDFLNVTRAYFRRVKTNTGADLHPLTDGQKITVGDEVEVQLSLRTKHAMEYVHLRDPRPAGFEPTSNDSRYKWDYGTYWFEEIRDSGTNFFFEQLPHGDYKFKYRIRAATAGEFKASPATVQPMYAPEFTAYSAGALLKIENK